MIVTVRVAFAHEDVAYDPDSVLLQDEANEYGVKTRTDYTVVAAGTPMVKDAVGQYSYEVSGVSPTELPLTAVIRVQNDDDVVYLIRLVSYESYQGRYTSRAELESAFGPDAVEQWADTDSSGDTNNSRINARIFDAEAVVDDYLRGGAYSVPFEEPIPVLIRQAATYLAGCDLYEARGVVDYDEANNTVRHRLAYFKKQAQRILSRIRNGVTQLEVEPSASTLPKMVCDGTSTDFS